MRPLTSPRGFGAGMLQCTFDWLCPEQIGNGTGTIWSFALEAHLSGQVFLPKVALHMLL